MAKLLEIIVMTTQDAVAAQAGGANHLEVVRDLHLGGLTPEIEMLKSIRTTVQIPLNVMVRPQSRDFVYTPDEIDIILREAEQVMRLGADGIVFGALTPEGDANIDLFRQVADVCRAIKPDVVMTFHRAIEEVRDANAALEELIGVADRVLCSGLDSSGAGDRSMLREWIGRYPELHFACGSGVVLDNLREIALVTGAPEYHVGTGAQTGGVVDQAKVEKLVNILAAV